MSQKTLETKVFRLSDYDHCAQSLFNAVRHFQLTHNTVQVFANDLFEDEDPKVEVVYSTIPFGLSHRPLNVVG
jgi:hypothetical protein